MDISNAIYTNKRVNDLSTQTTTAITTALNAAKSYADTEIEEAFDFVSSCLTTENKLWEV